MRLESDGYPLELPNLLFWAGIVLHKLSANQIVRCFKLKKYMRYKVDFLLPLKLQKIYYFVLWWKILLANQFAEFFIFDLFEFLILIPWVHSYIVIVFLFDLCIYESFSLLAVEVSFTDFFIDTVVSYHFYRSNFS